MSYAKFDPSKSNMKEICCECFGNVSSIARKMNVNRCTIYEYLHRDPVGRQILEYSRNFSWETHLDCADSVTLRNMLNFDSNPSLAQTAANKVIDKIGHRRYWGGEKLSEEGTQDTNFHYQNRIMELEAQLAKERNRDHNNKPEAESELSGINAQV